MTDMLGNIYPYGSRREEEPVESQEPQEQQQPIEQSQAPQEGAPLPAEKPEKEERFRVVANGKDYNMTKQELRQLYSEGYGDGIEIAQPYTIGDQTYHFTKKEAESAKLELEKRNAERQKESIKNLQLDSGTYMSKQHGRLQSVPIVERDEAGNEVVIGKSVKRERGGAIWYDEGVKFGKQGAGWYDQFGRRAADSMSGQSKSILPSKKAHEARVKEEAKGFMTADKAYTLQRLAQKEDYLSTFENHKYKDREFNKCRTAVIDGQNKYIRNGDNAVHMPDGPNGEGFYIKNPDGTLTRTKDFLAPEDATEMREIFKQQRQTRIENNRRNLLARGKTAEKIKEVTGSDFLADLPGDIGIGAKRVGLTVTRTIANMTQDPGVAEYADEELNAINQIDLDASAQAKDQGHSVQSFFLKYGPDHAAGLASNAIMLAASGAVGGAAASVLKTAGMGARAAQTIAHIASSTPMAGEAAMSSYNRNKEKFLEKGYSSEDAEKLATKAWNLTFTSNMAILGGIGPFIGTTTSKIIKGAWAKILDKTVADTSNLVEKELVNGALSKLTFKEATKETLKSAAAETIGKVVPLGVAGRAIDNSLQGDAGDLAKQMVKDLFSVDTIKEGLESLPTTLIMSGLNSFGQGRNFLTKNKETSTDITKYKPDASKDAANAMSDFAAKAFADLGISKEASSQFISGIRNSPEFAERAMRFCAEQVEALSKQGYSKDEISKIVTDAWDTSFSRSIVGLSGVGDNLGTITGKKLTEVWKSTFEETTRSASKLIQNEVSQLQKTNAPKDVTPQPGQPTAQENGLIHIDRPNDKLLGNTVRETTKQNLSTDIIKTGVESLPTLSAMGELRSFGRGRQFLPPVVKTQIDNASSRIKLHQAYHEAQWLEQDLKDAIKHASETGPELIPNISNIAESRLKNINDIKDKVKELYQEETNNASQKDLEDDRIVLNAISDGVSQTPASHTVRRRKLEQHIDAVAKMLGEGDIKKGRKIIEEMEASGIMTISKKDASAEGGTAIISKPTSTIYPFGKHGKRTESFTTAVVYHEVGGHLGLNRILTPKQWDNLGTLIAKEYKNNNKYVHDKWESLKHHYQGVFTEIGLDTNNMTPNDFESIKEQNPIAYKFVLDEFTGQIANDRELDIYNKFFQKKFTDTVYDAAQKWISGEGDAPSSFGLSMGYLIEGGLRAMKSMSARRSGTGKFTKNEKQLLEIFRNNSDITALDAVALLAKDVSIGDATSAFETLQRDGVVIPRDIGVGSFEVKHENMPIKDVNTVIVVPDWVKKEKKEISQLKREEKKQEKIDEKRRRELSIKKSLRIKEMNKNTTNAMMEGNLVGFGVKPEMVATSMRKLIQNRKKRIESYKKYFEKDLPGISAAEGPTKIKVDNNTEIEARGAATRLNKDNITLQSKVRESMKPMSNRVKAHQTLHELHWIKQDLQERADRLKKSGALISPRVKEAVSQRRSNLDAIQQGLIDVYKKETKGLTKEQEAKDTKSFELLEAMKIPTTLVDEDGATRTTDPSDAMKRARDTVADALGAGNRKAGHKVLAVMEATGVISIRDEDLAGMRGLANLTSSETSIFPLSGLGWIRDSVKKFSHTITGALYHEVGAHVGLEGILRNNHWTAIKNAIIDASINGDKETTEMWDNMVKLYRQEIPYTADIVTKDGDKEIRTPKNVETSPVSFFKNADPASIKIALHEFLGQMANTIDQKKSKHLKGIKKELIDATIDMVGNYGIDPAKLKDIAHVMIEGGLRRAQHMAERRAGTGEYTPAEKRFIELVKANPTKTAQEIATELATEVGSNEASSAFTSLKQDSVIIPQDSFFHEVPRHKQSRNQMSINLQEFGRVGLMSDHLNMPQTAVDRSVKAALSAIQKKKEGQKPLASKESVSEPDIFASLTDTGKELYNKLTSNESPKGPQITVPSYKKLFSKPMLFTMPRSFLELHSSKVRKLGSSINDYVGKVNSTRREFSETREDLSNHAKRNPKADKQLGLLLGLGSMYKNADDTVGRVFSFEEAQRHVPELTKETFDLYKKMTGKMKEAGKKLLDSYEVLHEKIAEQLKANFEGEELQRKLERNNEAFDNVKTALSNPAYWPLSRQGKYKTYFYAKNAKGEDVPFAVVMHNNKGKKGEAEIQAKLDDIRQQSTWANKKFNDGDFTTKTEIVPQTPDAFVSGISSLDSVMGDYIAAAAKIDPKVAEAISTELLSATMENNIATRMLKRGGIPGWDTNAAGVFDRFLSSISNAIANNEHAFDMNEALKEFSPERTGNNYDKNLHDEALGLVSHAKNPPQSPIINRITQIGFIKHMGFSMGFAVINKLQMMQTVIPTLANFYGLRKAASAAALGEYIADVVSEIHRLDKSLDTSDPKETMNKLNKVLTKSLLQSYFGGKATNEVLVNAKKAILHTVAKSLDTGSMKVEESMGLEAGKAGELLDKISKVSGVLAVKTEQSNRLATLIAYTILASENGGLVLDDNKGWYLDPEMKHDHSKEAEHTNKITNFVRGRGNQPAYLRQKGWQGAALKATFNYKSFTAGTIHLFHSLGLLNARKEKTKAAKAWAYAKPQLMHITSAALLGGPKAAVWFSILATILPDEWIEELTESAMKFIESKMQGAVKYSLGVHDDKEAKKIAKRTIFHLKHGVIPNALAGIDVHGNLDFNLVQDSNNKWEQIARGMMGSTVGDLTNIGVKVATGDKYGAIQGATPRFVKPLVDAATGKTHIGSGKSAELSTGDRVRRAIGVNATEVSMVRARQSEHIEFVTKQRDLLNNIMKEFREDAKRNNGKISNKTIKDAMKEVRNFNQQNKEKFQEFRLKMIKPTQVTGMRKRIMKGQKNLKWTISASGSDLELED